MATKKPERLLMRVAKGALAPADGYTESRLRARGFKLGDEVLVQITKARSPGFHRLVHQFGVMLVDNLDAFTGMDPHAALKRLQIEANVGCDEVALNFPGIGPCTYRVPRSLSYESMDQGEFELAFRAFTRYIAKTYWPSLTPEQIERMAGFMQDAA